VVSELFWIFRILILQSVPRYKELLSPSERILVILINPSLSTNTLSETWLEHPLLASAAQSAAVVIKELL